MSYLTFMTKTQNKKSDTIKGKLPWPHSPKVLKAREELAVRRRGRGKKDRVEAWKESGWVSEAGETKGGEEERKKPEREGTSNYQTVWSWEESIWLFSSGLRCAICNASKMLMSYCDFPILKMVKSSMPNSWPLLFECWRMEESEGDDNRFPVRVDTPLCLARRKVRFLCVSPTYRELHLEQEKPYTTFDLRSLGMESLNLKKEPTVNELVKICSKLILG